MERLLILLVMFSSIYSFAQTNTFPTTGNVGIGTTSPAQPLDVNGQSIFRNNLTINFGTTNRTTLLRDNGLYISRLSDGGYASTITANGSMYYDTRDNHYFSSDGQSILTVQNGGNVGIGTTTPGFKLDVNGSARFSGTTYLQGSLNYLNQGLADINNSNARLDFPGDGTVGITTGTSSAARKLTVLANGNVGIATTSPLSKLDIVTGVGDGTTNEANCLRLRSSAIEGNAMLLQMGVSNTGIGGNNNGYGYIGATYWGASDNNPLILNPKGGPVGIGAVTGLQWNFTVATSMAITSPAFTAQNDLMGKLIFALPGSYGANSSFIAGVYDKTLFSSGTGIVFHTISGADISSSTGLERMRISSDGNVGIGTASLTEKLTVSGNISLANQTNAYQINYAALSETTSGASTILGNNVKAGTSNNTIKRFSNGSDAGSYISLNYYNGITFHTGIASALNTEVSSFNNEVMRITQDSKIGIGTATPSEKLDVYGNVKATGFILPTGAAAGKVLTSDASGNASWQTASGGSASWAFDGSTVGTLKKIGTADNYALPFITSNTEWMRITTTGNVGIGTTSPSEKLAVNGNIVSKKVKVTQTGWADYVFHTSYKLPPLQEVEAYIKQHQHLPDIPSAEEVEKNGLDLGDTQAALLKKIEELTLYVIEIKKENEQMKKKIKELQKRK